MNDLPALWLHHAHRWRQVRSAIASGGVGGGEWGGLVAGGPEEGAGRWELVEGWATRLQAASIATGAHPSFLRALGCPPSPSAENAASRRYNKEMGFAVQLR